MTTTNVSVRRAAPEDAGDCARICFEAFSGINEAHGFPSDIPAVDVAQHLMSMLFAAPGFYGVAAEVDGKIVGSNFLDERAVISGVGPITVDRSTQNSGIGRKLMEAVLDRAQAQRAPGVRLVQAAFHNRSLSLYTNLGFDAKEPLS